MLPTGMQMVVKVVATPFGDTTAAFKRDSLDIFLIVGRGTLSTDQRLHLTTAFRAEALEADTPCSCVGFHGAENKPNAWSLETHYLTLIVKRHAGSWYSSITIRQLERENANITVLRAMHLSAIDESEQAGEQRGRFIC